MIIYTRNVPLTGGLKEIVQHRERDFPHAAMESDMDLLLGHHSPWHWHGEYEFATLERGQLELRTRAGAQLLEAGDVYFVNANVLHLCAAVGDSSVRMHVHLFGGELIGGGGLVARRYLRPVAASAGVEALCFRGGEAEALRRALDGAFQAAASDAPGCELEICAHLTEAWAQMYKRAAPLLRRGGGEAPEALERTKAMLAFIHENYGREIDVEDIARAAGVCERECFRCFKRVLDTTPRAYLTEYRVSEAARRLAAGADSVTRIALDCGFATPSYFGKVFRRVMGCSPRAFRSQ